MIRFASALSLSCILAITVSSAADPTWREVNGLVVIEAEAVTMNGTWTVKTSPLTGFTGSGYIEAGSSGTLLYTISFATAATYRFNWRNAAEHTTDYNDTYVRMTGPSVTMLAGGGAPCLTSGFAKVFNNAGGDVWAWQTKNCDNTSKQIDFVIAQAGTYVFEVKYRSTRHKIDRIVFFDQSKVSETASHVLTLAQTLDNGTNSVESSTRGEQSVTRQLHPEMSVFALDGRLLGQYKQLRFSDKLLLNGTVIIGGQLMNGAQMYH